MNVTLQRKQTSSNDNATSVAVTGQNATEKQTLDQRPPHLKANNLERVGDKVVTSAPRQEKNPKEMEKQIQMWKSNQKKLSDTATQPICLLCRRKFATHEKLKLHCEKSELHQENLRKRRQGALPISIAAPKTVVQATKAATAAGYVDRAGDRRKMFGQESKHGPMFDRSKGAEEVDRIETPLHVAETDNKGSKLLKMMGWKEGRGLGRTGDGITAPIDAPDFQ